jgi:uncharacterized phiE125 gp8 family phage protein
MTSLNTIPPVVSFVPTVAASTEPITPADVLVFLRVTDAAQTAEVTAYAVAAREYVEKMTGRSLSDEERALYANGWASGYDMDRTPIASVESVKYWPADFSAQVTVDPSNYYLVAGEPARVMFKESFAWPALWSRPDAVEVRYTLAPSVAPTNLLHAMKMLAADMYEYRTPTITGTIVARTEILQNIINSHRLGGFVS